MSPCMWLCAWPDCLVTALQGENSCARPFPARNLVPGDVLLEGIGDHVWLLSCHPSSFSAGRVFLCLRCHSGDQNSPQSRSELTWRCAAEMAFPALPWRLKKPNSSISDRMPWQMLLLLKLKLEQPGCPHSREEGGQQGHGQAGCWAGSSSNTTSRNEVLHKSNVLVPFPRALWTHSSLPPTDMSCSKSSLSLYICSHRSGNELIQSYDEHCCFMGQQLLSAA